MKRHHFILISIVFSLSTFGQKTISGIIIDKKNEPIIGASISEMETNLGTVSDINGRFSITTSNSTACIRISYIGFKDTTICNSAKTLDSIQLSIDSSKFSDNIVSAIDRIYVNNLTFGYDGGIFHNPYGFSIVNFTPFLFQIPLMTTTRFNYCTNFTNNYNLRLGISRYKGSKFKEVDFGISYDFEKLNVNDKTSFDYLSHKLNADLKVKKIYYFLGYGYSRINNNYYNGILSGISITIPKTSVNLHVECDYWFDYFEYSVNLFRTIPKTKFSANLGFRQIDNYKEINLGLRYDLN